MNRKIGDWVIVRTHVHYHPRKFQNSRSSNNRGDRRIRNVSRRMNGRTGGHLDPYYIWLIRKNVLKFVHKNGAELNLTVTYLPANTSVDYFHSDRSHKTTDVDNKRNDSDVRLESTERSYILISHTERNSHEVAVNEKLYYYPWNVT